MSENRFRHAGKFVSRGKFNRLTHMKRVRSTNSQHTDQGEPTDDPLDSPNVSETPHGSKGVLYGTRLVDLQFLR